MLHRALKSPIYIALAALCASIAGNIFAHRRIQGLERAYRNLQSTPLQPEDDSHYTYVDDDHPIRLPVHLPPVALKVEETSRFGISNYAAWEDWRTTDWFPQTDGFVRLGPDGRLFGVSMFHQMHCLQLMRDAVIHNQNVTTHTHHCLNLLRQMILCASDTTLDPINIAGEDGSPGANGVGTVHVCKDWQRAYDFVTDNQKSAVWNSPS
ncbi:hypothetical protein FIBSPDRAFT_1050224 [Athelia psychrophila]|uniref:Oxidase ustYa n=1 Tax=Athelia psychrophila TaxID=1759441 RepID=A0A166B262_9AGAM|nr:hypothetical protein FIBSPDRAFT_1050224 [Fibularhizoctonia sp. CBS 109695]